MILLDVEKCRIFINILVICVGIIPKIALAEVPVFGSEDFFGSFRMPVQVSGKTGFWFSQSLTSVSTEEKRGYLIDSELYSLRAGFRAELIKGFNGSVAVSASHVGGGILDSSIDAWHEFFGLPEGNRRDVPRDDYAVEGILDNDVFFEITETGFHFQKLSVGLEHIQSGIGVYFGLPLSDNQLTFQGPELALAYRTELYPSADLQWSSFASWMLDTETIDGLRPKPFVAKSSLFGCVDLLDETCLLLGLSLSSSEIDNLKRYPGYYVYLSVGLRFSLDDLEARVGLRENLLPDDGTADIQFFIDIS